MKTFDLSEVKVNMGKYGNNPMKMIESKTIEYIW